MVKINIDLKKWWTISLVLYIICSSAFSYGTLRMLNTYALYFFFGMSVINIIQRKSIKLNAAAASIILYLVLMLIGMLYTPTSAKRTENIMYLYITMAILAFCVVQYIDTMKDVNTVIFAYMLAGLALAIYVYAQYGSEFWSLMQSATDYESGHVDRLGSNLTNSNTISMYTMISALIALYYVFFDRESKIRTIFCIMAAAFCFVVSMAGASRKSIVLLLAAFVCFWLYSSLGDRNILKQMRNVLLLVGGVIVLFWLIATQPIFSAISVRMDTFFNMFRGGEVTSSEVNRSGLIDRGIAVWMDNFLFGDGTAASMYYFGVYSHNNFVEILMNTGVVGFLVFYGIYPVAIYLYWRNAVAYKAQSKLAILLFAILVSLTACGIGLVYYYERYEMILLTVTFSAIRVFNTEKTLTEARSEEGKA